MNRLYKILIIVIFIYAAGHMAYTFYYDSLQTTESKAWFFSAGLATFFNALINMIHLQLKIPVTRNYAILTNITLLIFLFVLSAAVPEIQVYVFIMLMLATTVVSARVARFRKL